MKGLVSFEEEEEEEKEQDSEAFSGLDDLLGAKEWHFRAWEKFRLKSIVELGLADATAEEVQRRLDLNPENLDEVEKFPLHFAMGWY